MTTAKNNVCYFQSGGPTQVINSSFLGLFDTFRKDPKRGKFYVSRFGVNGLLNGELESVIFKRDFSSLLFTPGANFGSARVKLPEDLNAIEWQNIRKTIEKYRIGYLFVNGGNDSMDTANKISLRAKEKKRNLKVIGIPKTIDNDLLFTDHCPGFGSAAKRVANASIAIQKDDYSYQTGRINILETRGRDSGFLAASSLLAKKKGLAPDFIYVPESAFDLKTFLDKAISRYKEKGHCFIVVSEGIRNKEGKLILASKDKDSFGNIQNGGVADYLASLLSNRGRKTRGIELSLLNRAGTFLPSFTDIKEAYECGKRAYIFATLGTSGKRVVRKRLSSKPYRITYVDVPLSRVANKAKKMPLSYLTTSGDNIRDSYLDYVSPLIQGERKVFGPDGLLSVFGK